jgi:hypothetical protein
LERAKTGDILKAKIQQRPNRQELERRHILPNEGHVDPSLADKYRMLEKALLVDQLNSKISHRPGMIYFYKIIIIFITGFINFLGPLELIEKNILHANEPIERIVKEGLVPFKASSSDELNAEDDSQSSEGDLSLLDNNNAIIKTEVIRETPIHDQVIVNDSDDSNIYGAAFKFETINIPTLIKTPSSTSTTTSTFTPLNESTKITFLTQPPETLTLTKTTHSLFESQPLIENKSNECNLKQHISSFIQNNQNKIGGKEKNRKKCKIKPIIKTRAIKFHEYKGPPNAQKNSFQVCSNKKSAETNYELIMQQQCLLEYLEGIYRSPKSQEMQDKIKSLPSETNVSDKIYCEEMKQEDVKKPFITIFPTKTKSPSSSLSVKAPLDQNSTITLSDVNKMKVSELKVYLKKLNLAVSGPKPLLVERLKPFLPLKLSDMQRTSIDECRDTEVKSNDSDVKEPSLLNFQIINQCENSVNSIQGASIAMATDEDIVREQQRKIEELQRKLKESQNELEQIKQIKTTDAPFLTPIQSDFKKEPFLKLLPNGNDLLTKYQMPNAISTVFVVGVSSSSSSSSSPPGTQEIVNATTTTPATVPIFMHETTESYDKSANVTSPKIVKDHHHLLETDGIVENKPIVNAYEEHTIVHDDINDVLEILLENEKWKVAKNDIDCSVNSTADVVSNFQPPFSESFSSPLHEISDVTLRTAPLGFEEKKLSDSLNNNSFIDDFQMDIEDNSCPVTSTSNMISDSEMDKPHIFSGGDEMVAQNNYNLFNNSTNGCFGVENNIDELNKNGIKNSLIGNFDRNLFDTFKNNMTNSNVSKMFRNDQKDISASDKCIFNNNINNFEVFGNGMNFNSSCEVPMEFETSMPYEIYAHDPFFNFADTTYSSFNDGRDSLTINNNNFITQVNETSNDIFCEVDSMLESKKVL